MRFLHAADLHLSRAEREYSFSVLDEILGIARRERCGALLLAGDIFDSCAEAEALRTDFRARLETLPADCAVYFLPGNHEALGSAAGRGNPLEGFDFGRARMLTTLPFSLENLSPEAELLALPFRRDYSDYRDWPVPPKKKPLRIILSHGTVPGIVYTGPDEDDEAGALDPDIFAFFQADLAALGHIHGGSESLMGGTIVAYPGSARVWREGETGPRRVLLGTTETMPPRLEEVVLESAGEFRILAVQVGIDGTLRLAGSENTPRGADWIRLDVTGVTEDERPVLGEVAKLRASLERSSRRVTVDAGGLEVLAGVSTHPLAVRFVKKWEELSAVYPEEAEGYRLARLKGLRVLKGILESRK